MSWKFIVLVIGTIVVCRIFLWLFWESSFMVAAKADGWHHAYTGGILILFSYLFKTKINTHILESISAVGLGLLLDEITVPFCWMGMPVDYWSIESIAATAIGVVILLGLNRYALK